MNLYDGYEPMMEKGDVIGHEPMGNITGTIYLIQKVGRDMRTRGQGRILITGSIAGFIPGTYQAVYSGTKSFLNSFSFALRAKLKDSGVTITCLMPGATETEFFERRELMDTQPGANHPVPRRAPGRLPHQPGRRHVHLGPARPHPRPCAPRTPPRPAPTAPACRGCVEPLKRMFF